MKATPANEKFYWNSRAANYPQPFEREMITKSRRIIKLAEGLGIKFAGKRLLDIGCGTGNYALPLAARAKNVTGVDGSPGMLRVFRAQARAHGIKNARAIVSKWKTLPGRVTAGKFDIALASMTMAVHDKAEVLKMERSAAQCVYIGWAGVRRNAFLEKIYRHHGLAYKAPPGADLVLPVLKALGRKFKLKYIRDGWTKAMTPAETLKEIEVAMKVNGARPDYKWLGPLLMRTARGGVITQRTLARKAIIVWQAP
ncbi:MAG: methyltransferase domain-containing protein [Elusimicrobiales bacterium]|nr:methyltransferase domain-containing protein [Elusimicrobiales bacterium]